MHDLIPLGPALLPGILTVAEIDSAIAYAEAEKALATRAAYASDWKDFSIWCLSRGATPLPAHVGIVATYLSGSLIAAARPAPSADAPPLSATATRWPATSRRPTRRPSRRSCAASAARRRVAEIS